MQQTILFTAIHTYFTGSNNIKCIIFYKRLLLQDNNNGKNPTSSDRIFIWWRWMFGKFMVIMRVEDIYKCIFNLMMTRKLFNKMVTKNKSTTKLKKTTVKKK